MQRKKETTRREFFQAISAGAVVALARPPVARAADRKRAASAAARAGDFDLRSARGFVRLADGSLADAAVFRLERTWSGDVCRSRLTNITEAPLAVREVVLFSGPHAFGPKTKLYGESFQMLSQTTGTLGEPVKLGYDEFKHYKLPETEGATTVRSLVMLAPENAPRHLVAATSCRRFSCDIRLWPDRFEIALDVEERVLAPGASWELEDFAHFVGDDREVLLAQLAARVQANHPRLAFPKIPTGWCSWYFYGKRLTEDDIMRNLDAIAKDGIGLEYIQIDDGYQPAHGDWLDDNPKFFPSGIQALCRKIRERGFEPAIWVAPFIASAKSRLLREHPEWFVQGEDGRPLSAEAVTFRGWNDAPWFMLDATIPEVQEHLEKLFRTLREAWGVSYFKLDANFWGAVRGCRYRDAGATRIDNYRRGMEAILRGAGDAFVLGCNAPMWASLGLVHGMRVTGDISRSWSRVTRCARELFFRNWQHGRFWINDPDCIVLDNKTRGGIATLSPDEFGFQAAAIVASGAMVLSGDDYAGLNDAEKTRLRRTLPPAGMPARFEDESFECGVTELPDGRRLLFFFNWSDAAQPREFVLPRPHVLADFWSGEKLGTAPQSRFAVAALPPHSARVVLAAPV
jgi:alpha-galactosidase